MPRLKADPSASLLKGMNAPVPSGNGLRVKPAGMKISLRHYLQPHPFILPQVTIWNKSVAVGFPLGPSIESEP
jgi:hypothetical protein